MRRLLLAVAAILVVLASCAFASDPASYSAFAGAERGISADSQGTHPTVGVSVDAPIAFKATELGRLLVDLKLSALPGAPLSLDRQETWANTVEVQIVAARQVGAVGDHRTQVIALYGLATSIERDEVLFHFAQAYGLGLRLANVERHAWVQVAYGRHERIVEGHQLLLSGAYPLGPAPGGAVVSLRAETVVTLDHRRSSPDLFRLSVVISR